MPIRRDFDIANSTTLATYWSVFNRTYASTLLPKRAFVTCVDNQRSVGFRRLLGQNARKINHDSYSHEAYYERSRSSLNLILYRSNCSTVDMAHCVNSSYAIVKKLGHHRYIPCSNPLAAVSDHRQVRSFYVALAHSAIRVYDKRRRMCVTVYALFSRRHLQRG